MVDSGADIGSQVAALLPGNLPRMVEPAAAVLDMELLDDLKAAAHGGRVSKHHYRPVLRRGGRWELAESSREGRDRASSKWASGANNGKPGSSTRTAGQRNVGIWAVGSGGNRSLSHYLPCTWRGSHGTRSAARRRCGPVGQTKAKGMRSKSRSSSRRRRRSSRRRKPHVWAA